ncbi:hypothetical protein [Romboutsia sp. 13368]|uniref:hypothetical protein n=1 Tax=Romboutsia sp. 13368 TaxID=2708053 RepID=UPI0025F432D2|nr:hypothetical protein [Romboutsia sp. 13368]
MINELDLDIKRCEDVLIENNYLEIVIAIEELHDKYKNTIDSISNINSNVVWNYSKKDIENIQKSLKEYKEELILKEKQKSIEEKIKDLKFYIEKNNILKKNNVLEVIKSIEEINNADLNLDEKWNKLKGCLDILKNQEREIGTKLLEIIVLVSK